MFICARTYGGKKSSAEGIDLEFERDSRRFFVSIKSGPNWGNSGQIAKLKDNFRKAKRILGTNTANVNVVAVNGCCYGRDNKPDKGEYIKYCGQQFWELISGDSELYTELIQPLGLKAKQRNETFQKEYSKVINRFTLDFSSEYCDDTGAIDWSKLVRYASERKTKSKS